MIAEQPHEEFYDYLSNELDVITTQTEMTTVKQRYQELFDYLSNEFNRIAILTEMQEIERIVLSKHEQKEQILQFLYDEITERRDYSASKMCEEVIKFIKQLK